MLYKYAIDEVSSKFSQTCCLSCLLFSDYFEDEEGEECDEPVVKQGTSSIDSERIFYNLTICMDLTTIPGSSILATHITLSGTQVTISLFEQPKTHTYNPYLKENSLPHR